MERKKNLKNELSSLSCKYQWIGNSLTTSEKKIQILKQIPKAVFFPLSSEKKYGEIIFTVVNESLQRFRKNFVQFDVCENSSYAVKLLKVKLYKILQMISE